MGYKVSNVTEGITEFCFVRVPEETEETLVKEEDLCPTDRFQVDFKSGTIVDQVTGEKYVRIYTPINEITKHHYRKRQGTKSISTK